MEPLVYRSPGNTRMLVKTTKLTITDQRLIVSQGVFHKITNETELYRVRDTSIEEPFFYRMFGVGNIVVYSTDEAEGKLLFNAFHKPHWIKDQIRNYAEICRRNRRWGTATRQRRPAPQPTAPSPVGR